MENWSVPVLHTVGLKNVAQKKLKKTHPQIYYLFHPYLAVKTTQTEVFKFQNVAIRPTVYKAGEGANKK